MFQADGMARVARFLLGARGPRVAVLGNLRRDVASRRVGIVSQLRYISNNLLQLSRERTLRWEG